MFECVLNGLLSIYVIWADYLKYFGKFVEKYLWLSPNFHKACLSLIFSDSVSLKHMWLAATKD